MTKESNGRRAAPAPYNLDANILIRQLQQQRNQALDDAARANALVESLAAENEKLRQENESLKAPAEAEAEVDNEKEPPAKSGKGKKSA